MWTYLLGRLVRLIIAVLGILAIVFVLIRLSGDPISLFIDENFATREQIENVRRQLGLDSPLPVQFIKFLTNALQGDFGISYRRHVPALQVVLEGFPATVELAIFSITLSVLVAVPFGVFSSTRPGSLPDEGAMVAATLGQSVPTFWLGIVLIIVFAVYLRVLPTSGRGGLDHMLLPALTLATRPIALGSRLVRSAMLDVLGLDFIRTARSKGLSERHILYGHALRNALIPIITIMGVEFSVLLGGAIITETVFAWPGVGYLMIQAILMRDYPVVQAGVVLIATFVVLVNTTVDLLYAAIDPRIRL